VDKAESDCAMWERRAELDCVLWGTGKILSLCCGGENKLGLCGAWDRAESDSMYAVGREKIRTLLSGG
jgi:hypothetical protein